jgi:nitrate reductase NapAB chaperone NapD
MAIAGVVIVPVNKEQVAGLKDKLDSLEGVEVQAVGEKGIAVVLEADDSTGLRSLSEKINNWDEVIDFQLGYLNWEEVE